MPIKVNRLYNLLSESSEESKQAEVFASFIENALPRSASGSVYILPNMLCHQARNKDLDLVVWFDIKDLEINAGCGVEGAAAPRLRTVKVESALLIFELKAHNTYNSVRIQNQNLELKYEDGYHNVSQQSEGQKYALINFLKSQIGVTPFISNLIWMYNTGNLQHQEALTVNNILWGDPSLTKVFQVAFNTNLPKLNSYGQAVYNASLNDFTREEVTRFFETLNRNSAVGIGRISRKKIHELINKDIARLEQNYFNSIGNKITIIKGNPGTGKTIHLIHLANNLYKKRSLSSLVLTFNKALQQDIKRLIHYSDLGEESKIDISTYDGFINDCLSEYEEPKENAFNEWPLKLKELIKASDDPRNDFLTAQKYDCVLIDEGQDWSDEKKEIIFALFDHKYTVVSIGVNQMIECQSEQNWSNGIPRDERQEFHLEISHRNKINIVDFLKMLSKKSQYNWDLVNNRRLIGGRVLVTNQYNQKIHNDLVSDLQSNDNSFYDMMFLAGKNVKLQRIEEMLNTFGHLGFIANKPENREKMFPLDQFRILTYQACRGLEAWTIVCYEWDAYIENVLTKVEDVNTEKLIQTQFFIVMTRAIDTLVITLKNPESELSQRIISTARRLPEISEIWI